MNHMAHGPCIHEYFQWPEHEHRLHRQVGGLVWFSPTLPLKIFSFLFQSRPGIALYYWSLSGMAVGWEGSLMVAQGCFLPTLWKSFINFKIQTHSVEILDLQEAILTKCSCQHKFVSGKLCENNTSTSNHRFPVLTSWTWARSIINHTGAHLNRISELSGHTVMFPWCLANLWKSYTHFHLQIPNVIVLDHA